MADIVFLTLATAVFATAFAYVRGCERLAPGRSK
jgi:hypothetical protein